VTGPADGDRAGPSDSRRDEETRAGAPSRWEVADAVDASSELRIVQATTASPLRFVKQPAAGRPRSVQAGPIFF
jgi:hypothetical protein